MGYLCAYYRYHHPIEFITSFLNNAANEDDIKSGTKFANKIGIDITMPRWGLSRGDYFFDTDRRIIAKGLSSVKYMGEKIANELYEISNNRVFKRFIDVLTELDRCSTIDSRQLDILIKLDFFSEFGNQRELLRIVEMFDLFKKGSAKKISKDKVDGTPMESIVSKYSVGVTKSGGVAKSYTLLDVRSILYEIEDLIKSLHMSDLSDIIKVQNFADVMGYVGYTSGKEEDRRKLYILEIYPVRRKKDDKQFGYSIITKSIGSGKESRFTIFNRVYDQEPLKKGDIIFCKSFTRDGPYYQLTGYEKLA